MRNPRIPGYEQKATQTGRNSHFVLKFNFGYLKALAQDSVLKFNFGYLKADAAVLLTANFEP